MDHRIGWQQGYYVVIKSRKEKGFSKKNKVRGEYAASYNFFRTPYANVSTDVSSWFMQYILKDSSI